MVSRDGSMKKRTKKIFLFGAGALVLLTGSFLVYEIYSFMSAPLFGEEQPHQPDDVMIANFREHRADFEQLKTMLIRDALITRVDCDWTDPDNLPKEVTEDYRRLFKIVGTPRGISASLDRSQIDFIASSQGWVASGSSNGYAFLAKPPEITEDSLDHYTENRGQEAYAFRHIDGNWYLFFER